MRFAECHPERKHRAKGLCVCCYNHQYFMANREKRRERNRRWRAANPEKKRELDRRSYAANREKRCEKARRHRAVYPERHRQAVRRYVAANRDKVREAQGRYWHSERALALNRKKHWRRYYGELKPWFLEALELRHQLNKRNPMNERTP